MSDVKLLEIPESVSNELIRLHELIKNKETPIGTKDWAIAMVTQIHKSFFNGRLEIVGNNL